VSGSGRSLRLKSSQQLCAQIDCLKVRWQIDASAISSVYGTEQVHGFIMCNGPTNALVCNKTLIQMSHIKTLKITPTCFDHQMIIIRELFDPG
jgi:hypothetical protein